MAKCKWWKFNPHNFEDFVPTYAESYVHYRKCTKCGLSQTIDVDIPDGVWSTDYKADNSYWE